MKSALAVLKERGFIAQCTALEELDELMSKKKISFYVGVDPTADSMHVGHLVPFFAMAHLQKVGHKPIALVGGATARIGDPTGKTEMRKMLSGEDIDNNARLIGQQIQKFIPLDGENGKMVNNYDWMGDKNYIEFLRDVGKHFSVNKMLSFETYKKRMETGLSFIEFNYQLLQSYDFLELHKRENCVLQIGGDDQWGNIVAGVDLIRRVQGHEAKSFGLTFPLVTTADGKKMGKTEKGALWLDPKRASPYDFFQYWRNIGDADVRKTLLYYTFLPVEEIDQLTSTEGSALNKAKEVLAYEFTKIVHGQEEAEKALAGAKAAFSAGGAADREGMPSQTLAKSELAEGIPAIDLFAMTTVCDTRADAKRVILQGGAKVNDRKVEELRQLIDESWLDDQGELILRAGKKKFFRLSVK
jgi:tyrosyl-tRNA synthetase